MGNLSLEVAVIEEILNEIAEMQHRRTLACGRRVVPRLTEDDMLQPNDFPALENHPEFRYEEGVLEGIRTVQMALRAYVKQSLG